MVETVTAAAALLLVASGVAKLQQPQTAAALVLRITRMLRLPGRWTRDRSRARGLVRAAGAGEVVVGAAVVVTGSRLAVALLAATYLVFTAVAVLLLRSGGAQISCGCFGSADSPLGLPHLVLDVVAAATALATVVRPPGPVLGLWDGAGSAALIGTLQALLLAALGYLAITSLPALLAARRALSPAAPTSVPLESR